MLRWNNLQRTAQGVPLVRLCDLTESLQPPEEDMQKVMEWMMRVEERLRMLRHWSDVETRQLIFGNTQEQRKLEDKFVEGKTKGIVNKILSKSTGVHEIENAWVGEAKVLTSDPREVQEATESFFIDWMRSHSEEWGPRSQRLKGEYAPPRAHPKIPCMGEVTEKVVKLLKRGMSNTEEGDCM